MKTGKIGSKVFWNSFFCRRKRGKGAQRQVRGNGFNKLVKTQRKRIEENQK